MTLRVIQLRKPKNCPKCGAQKIQPIWYVKPDTKLDYKTKKNVKRSNAVLVSLEGSRAKIPGLPDWECGVCHHRWFDKEDLERQKLDELIKETFQRK